MSLLFKAQDPQHRTVICTEDRWYDHVLNKRPWMESWVEEVKRAIEDPQAIYSSPDYENREAYYYHPSPVGYYIKVIVQFTDAKNGEVWTVYPTDKGKTGERLLWP